MKIEQTLHGYGEGHKLLATSVGGLSQQDRRKMSLLSDWDEYVSAQDDDSSYLTCYPLADSPYYVVAKTWYASEKERPGCVWTHSLLIDLREVRSFVDFLSLYPLFVRPGDGNYDCYDRTIETSEQGKSERMSGAYEQMASLDFWMFRLYQREEPLLLSYRGNSLRGQQFLLSLMNHVPWKMLLGMSFCSGTGRLRKYDGVVFDFQMTSELRRGIPRIDGKVNSEEKIEGWYTTIANSIINDDTDIPMVIARFSDEIGTRTEALAAVVMVFTLLDRLKEPGDANIQKFILSLRMIATAFPRPEDGARFKKVVLAENVARFFFGEETFVYQMATTEYWRSFDYGSFGYTERVRALVRGSELETYAGLMTEVLKSQTNNPAKKVALEEVVREYNDDEVALLAENYWDLYYYLCQIDDRMLNHKVWLTMERDKFQKILQQFELHEPINFEHWEMLATKLIWEDVPVDERIVRLIVEHEKDIVSEVLNRLTYSYHVDDKWLAYCKMQETAVMAWMKVQLRINSSQLRLILDTFDPTSEMVGQSDTSVWMCLLNAYVDTGIALEYCTFLFVLSYVISRNKEAFELYRRSFLPIYEATAADAIDEYWSKIGPYCPKPLLGLEWDKCDMLRKGFVERVFYEDRGVKVAKQFTTKSSLNKKLYKMLRKKYNE